MLAPSTAEATPLEPYISAVTPQPGAALVEWDSSLYGSDDAATVVSTPDSASCAASANTGRCIVTGLQNGTGYSFVLTVRSADGGTTSSTPSSPVTPRSELDPPVLVSSSISPERLPTAGGSVTISLHITDHGTGLAADPTVHFVPGSPGLPDVTADRVSGDALDGVYNAVVDIPAGLAGGIRVWLEEFHDVAGNSSGGERSLGDIAVGTPAAPTDVAAAVAGPLVRVVHLTWTPPTDDGGLPVTSYRIREAGTGFDIFTAGSAPEADIREIFDPGHLSSWTVIAENAAGASDPSDPSAPITVPAGLPDPPSLLHPVPLDRALRVYWTSPSSSEGAAVAGFTATAEPGGEQCSAAPTDIDVFAQRSCVIGGLIAGTTYSVTVTTTSGIGTSGPSLPDYGTPSGPAEPIAGVRVSQTGCGLTAAWTPSVNASAARVRLTRSDGSFVDQDVEKSTVTFDRLQNPRGPYRVSVAALRGDLLSAWAEAPPISALDCTSPPGAPARPTITKSTRTSAMVTWRPPDTRGRSAVSKYAISVFQGSRRAHLLHVSAPGHSLRVTGLRPGTRYTVRVSATNLGGPSAPSPSATMATRR